MTQPLSERPARTYPEVLVRVLDEQGNEIWVPESEQAPEDE